MAPTLNCSQVALAKILCHAAKHLTSTVNGLLMGKVEGETVQVTDAIPLFHASHALACPTELALAQVSAYVQQSGKSGYGIVGYYHSDSRFIAADLPPTGRKVADKVYGKQTGAVVLLLDNKKLASFMSGEDTHPFEVYARTGTQGWHKETASVCVVDSNWPGFQAEVSTLLKQRLHATLSDFDDHLDDISKDWLNPQFVNLGKMALPGQQA